MPHFAKILPTALLGTFLSTAGLAQETPQPGPEDSFASENAVLDTSILFAIGAREARQQLRGAFGWPTFQEGLVEGVYFRFDPDGYARFAPSPRLDTDVFEVICRPRTLVCMGRKDALHVTLNNRGQVQLELSNITENDQFILSDGITELPLPPTVLQPLEPRLELLLASGGEISVRRNNSEVHRISLAGFGAVVPYLRWVAAQQDYTVLPRGWPVPNAAVGNDNPGLTQTTLWQSPMPQPHVVTQAAPALAPAAVAAPAMEAQVGSDVAEVRGELNILRELLLGQQPAAAIPAPSPMVQPLVADSAEALVTRINELMQITADLQEELQRLKNPDQHMAQPQSVHGDMANEQPANTRDVARHLEYLMTEVGLAPDVALMVVQQAQQSQQASVEAASYEHNQVVNDILHELRAQLPADIAQGGEVNQMHGGDEYQLLSDYFRSVMPSQ